jgi:hypothetical protein
VRRPGEDHLSRQAMTVFTPAVLWKAEIGS